MTFDGVTYGSPGIVYPINHYPKAALTAFTLSNSLRNAYYASIHRSRIVFQQFYGMNGQAYSTVLNNRSVEQTAFTRIAEGRCFVPEAVVGASKVSITHMRAFATFSHMSISDVNVRHQITVDDGTSTPLVGGTSRRLAAGSSPGVFTFPFGGGATRSVQTPQSALTGSITEDMQVDVSTLVGDTVWQVYVEAYAVDGNDASKARTYWPSAVIVVWEVRT